MVTSPGGLLSNLQLRTSPVGRYEGSTSPHLMFEPRSWASPICLRRPPTKHQAYPSCNLPPPNVSLYQALSFYRVCIVCVLYRYCVLRLHSQPKLVVAFSKESQLQQSRPTCCTLLSIQCSCTLSARARVYVCVCEYLSGWYLLNV